MKNNMELLAELHEYDNSWYIEYIWWDKAVIANSSGKKIEAVTFRAALEIALEEYTQ